MADLIQSSTGFTEGDAKTILLVRHAKSSWDNTASNDFDRTLNDRGKKDGPAMAKRMNAKKILIDTIVSSPAKRAKKTAAFFADEFAINPESILYKTELYAAPTESFYEVIESLSSDAVHIAVFSHNPGITEFANSLTNTRIDDMPTCAIFAVKVKINHWGEFRKAEKEFWFFDFPKSSD